MIAFVPLNGTKCLILGSGPMDYLFPFNFNRNAPLLEYTGPILNRA